MYNKYPDRVEENGYGEDFAEIAFKDGSFGWIGSITGKFHSFAEEPLEDYEIVGNIYEKLDPRLKGAAALSVFAHLEALVQQGQVICDGEPTLGGRYQRV